MELVADDVVVWTDGGGLARAARNPIYGADKSARFLVAVAQTPPEGTEVKFVLVNGQPGVLLVDRGVTFTALALDIIDGTIVGVRVVSNPEKLSRLS
jgi:RNA polymerase sigma-70 factor (ECF subfamily)